MALRLTVVLLAAACGFNKAAIPAVTVVTGLDLARYSQRGFFFSPDPYVGPHDAMGLVSVTRYAGAHFVPPRPNLSGDTYHWEYDPLTAQAVLDTVYARAVALGADAFVKMEIRFVERARGPTGPTLPGVEISGFAIKRR